MHAIYESNQIIDKTEIPTFGREIKINKDTVITVEAGTAGMPKTKRGSSIAKTGITIMTNNDNIAIFTSTAEGAGIRFEVNGNDELKALIKTFKFVAQTLEDQINGIED